MGCENFHGSGSLLFWSTWGAFPDGGFHVGFHGVYGVNGGLSGGFRGAFG